MKTSSSSQWHWFTWWECLTCSQIQIEDSQSRLCGKMFFFWGAQNSFVGLVSGSFLSGSGARSALQVLVEMASISTHMVRCALICATYLVGCGSPNVCIPECLFFFSSFGCFNCGNGTDRFWCWCTPKWFWWLLSHTFMNFWEFFGASPKFSKLCKQGVCHYICVLCKYSYLFSCICVLMQIKCTICFMLLM